MGLSTRIVFSVVIPAFVWAVGSGQAHASVASASRADNPTPQQVSRIAAGAPPQVLRRCFYQGGDVRHEKPALCTRYVREGDIYTKSGNSFWANVGGSSGTILDDPEVIFIAEVAADSAEAAGGEMLSFAARQQKTDTMIGSADGTKAMSREYVRALNKSTPDQARSALAESRYNDMNARASQALLDSVSSLVTTMTQRPSATAGAGVSDGTIVKNRPQASLKRGASDCASERAGGGLC